jgi:flagellar hook protein FlgE
MGISSALYSGVSGLKTSSHAMSVIGNNLAHTNTTGFKGARTVFSDLLSANVSGSGGTSQIGRGVNLSKVDNVFSQGTFEATESGLDVAIEGDSFFTLREDGDDTTYYTRAGAFRFDEDGFLINPEGYRVQGQQFNPATNALLPGDPSDIHVINSGLIPASATTAVDLTTNLDADATTLTSPFLYTDPETYNYSTSVQVFDSLGNNHLITTYYRKDPVANTWNWYWSAQDSTGTDVGSAVTGTAAQLTFDTDGTKLTPPAAVAIGPIDWLNGADPSDITIDFDTTQFNSNSAVIAQDQDGFAAGDLTSVDINEEGIVVASYSNGEQTNIAQLVLAKFQNPGGLIMKGSNMFVSTAASGTPRTGLPGPELGKIFTNSLEQSNVDMGTEFVRMITVQRGFQANSKIITTIDELLGELINLKR